MLPYIHILYRQVPVYGLCMMLGAALGWALCRRRATRLSPPLSPQTVDRCFVWIGGWALVGAKLYSLVLVRHALVADLPLLTRDPALFLQKYLYGGMVFYGGLLGVLGAVVWLLCRRKISFSLLERVFLPSLPLVHALGRVGCFCAGCCYGKVTDSFWGVCYPPGGLAPAGIPLLPVQLWEAGGNLLLLGLLLLPLYHRTGQRLSAYLIGYGSLRFLLEFFRGDPARGLAGPLSGAQWISLGCLAVGCLFLWRSSSRKASFVP